MEHLLKILFFIFIKYNPKNGRGSENESSSPDVRTESGTSRTRPENVRTSGCLQDASGNCPDVRTPSGRVLEVSGRPDN